MPDKAGGPCQAPGEEVGTFCGETLSSCWYGKARQGIHFCSIHRAAWNDFRQHGATEAAEEATVLREADEFLGSRYCEPSIMESKQRRNKVGKSTLQFCVQGTFNCAQDDERGETDARWQTLDELLEAGCSREEFNGLCAAHVTQLQKTMRQDAKRFKTALELVL